MANRWGKKWKVTDFISLGPKITVDGDCSHEIKRHLLLGRKAMTNLDNVLRSRDNTLLTKDHIVKAMDFPLVMYGCEIWTIKKDECWRIDAFELWCWIRLLRVPWTARRSNQSILKKINPEYSLEGLILKMKLQQFGYLIQTANSLERTLMLGKIEGRRRRGQRMRWLDGSLTWWMWVWVNSGSWWWTRRPGVLQSMGLQRVGHEWATELNWTEDSQKEGDPLTSPRSSSTWRHPCLAFSPQLKAKVTGISDPETSLQAKLLVVVSLATHITGAENARWAEIHACCFTEMY